MKLNDQSFAVLGGLHERPRRPVEAVAAWRGRYLGLFIVGATACASIGESATEHAPDDPRVVPPPADAGFDVASEAGPCTDCEYFPDVCSPTVLCPNDPFGSDTVGGGLDPRLTINVIRGRSVSDVWAAGALGALAHFDGTSWTRSDLGSRETLRALWLHDSGEIAVSMFEHAYTRGLDIADAGAGPSPGGWTLILPSIRAADETFVTYRMSSLASAWGQPGGDWLWYVATSRYTKGRVTGLWRMRRSPGNVFEVGSAVSTSACAEERCWTLNGIHGASANELWAVGEMGAAVLVSNADGDVPSVKAFNTQTRNSLKGVWVASPSAAWAVGAQGTIRHYSGDPLVWDIVLDVPTNEDLQAVWGSSSSDVWAVGKAGVVIHYDGENWSRVKIAGLGERRPDFTTVWVPEPGHVWVGGKGVMLSLGGKP